MKPIPLPPSADNVSLLPAPAWRSFEIPILAGRETYRGTGKRYSTLPLIQLFTVRPSAFAKMDGFAFIPSTYNCDDARNHAVQRQNGRFVALTADIDDGDHPRERIEAAVRSFADDAPWLLYSSSSSRLGYRKWRVIVPLRSAVDFQTWGVAQTLFHNHFADAKIEPDRAMARAGQIVFLPNVPPVHEGTGVHLREGGTADGAPLFFEHSHAAIDAEGLDLVGSWIAVDILALTNANEAEEARRRAASEEAIGKRAARAGNGATPIDHFNAIVDLADLLVKYGYEEAPHNGTDWRSPLQASASYATRVIIEDDGRQHWISLSQSDREAGLGHVCSSGCHGDAFDLFVHYEQSGDWGAALAAIKRGQPSNDFDGVMLPTSPLPEPRASRFQVLTLDELEHEEPRTPVIKGLIARGDLCCIFGPPSAGKSVLGPYLALRVAQGQPAFGMKTVAGAVLYVGAEDPHGMGQRLRAVKSVFGDAVSLYLVKGLAGIMADPRSPEMNDLHRCINRLSPSLVVIDTLSVGFPVDENAALGMGGVVQTCRMIAAQDPAVMLIHHPPKGDQSTPRGHSILNGALDMALRVAPPDKAGVIRCTCTKNRNGFPRSFGFKIRSEALGFDSDGDLLSAPVCEEVDLRSLPMGLKLSSAKRAALAILDEMVGSNGRAAAAAWRTECIVPGAVSRSKIEKCRSDIFARLKRELQSQQQIVIDADQAGEWVGRRLGFSPDEKIETSNF